MGEFRIADAHCDALSRIAAHGLHSQRSVTYETLRAGRVGFQVFALFATRKEGDPLAWALAQREAFEALVAESGGALRKVTAPASAEDATNAMLSIEDCACLGGSLERIHEFYRAGVRIFGLLWNHENELGHSAIRDGGGLTCFGQRAAREMARLGAAVDTAHLSERGFWDLLDLGVMPCCTHANAKSLCAHPRNLSDDQLRALFACGGFAGVCFYPHFLCEGRPAALDDIVRHILHMLELGGGDCVGFGSDFDGIEVHPEGVEDPSSFPAILEAMLRAGIREEQVHKIACENLMRYLRKAARDA